MTMGEEKIPLVLPLREPQHLSKGRENLKKKEDYGQRKRNRLRKMDQEISFRETHSRIKKTAKNRAHMGKKKEE